MFDIFPIENDSTENTQEVSVFKDPFNSSYIDEIVMHYRKPLFAKSFVWQGTVYFKNGLTKGEQRTPECPSWEDFMLQMKQIYNSLNSKPI